eukprot:8936514-Lingulodinium_polyedra.AAC.1
MAAVMGSLLLMHPGGGGHGGPLVATTRQPPSWGPSMESSPFFRRWARDIVMWCQSIDINEDRQ